MQFDNPLIVQSDRTLLLDVHAPRAAECRNALIPFAELERSPEHLHTYRLTALSLWNASGAGFKPEQAIGVLKEFSRYDVPQSVEQWILETAGRFGKLRLVQGPKIDVPLTAANPEGKKDPKQITEEYLYYFPNGRQAKIFDRKDEKFTVGSKFRGKFSSCKDVLKPNRLLLSCAANFTAVEEVADAFSFFNNELVVYSAENQDNWMNYSLYQINSNEKMKRVVLSLTQDLGMGVKDIKVSIDQKKMESIELPPFLTDEFKNMLLQTKVDAITAKVVYEKFETDLLQDESTGVRKLFALLCPMIDILVNGKVLLCDELEASLHEALVYELVKLFMTIKTDKFAQIIFTTHETGLLNLDLFRRDQIWFTEMEGTDRSTDLYSLAEIKNVRKDDNFGKGYITGKYGAIPMLNVNFADIVSKM